jgi:cell division protein FtsZ
MVLENNLAIKNPILIMGIGGAGSRIARDACKTLNSECVLISNDTKDLIENFSSILIDPKSWVNPSSYKLRSYAQDSAKRIRQALLGYNTVVVVANLAGRGGSAIAPVVCRLAKEESNSKTVVSFVIMPFKFEKDRIFQAGISLKRIREASDATIVIDNDAFLNNNPELSAEECYQITNRALSETIGLVCCGTYTYTEMSLLCTSSNHGGAELASRDSVAMLYQNAYPGSAKSAMLYVMGGKKVPLGLLNSLFNTLQQLFRDDGNAGVAIVASDSDERKVHLLASFDETTRFEEYDPLSRIIPEKNVLDWDDMDCSPDIELAISNLE